MADLTTIAAVKTYLGKTDAGDDAVLTALVSAYSQWVISWTNRDFTSNTYDVWRSGRGQVTMLLPQWPIISVQTVNVDGMAILPSPTFGAYGFRFTDRMVTLDGGAIFNFGANNVQIVYTAGYASVPLDIAQAVNELVGLRYKMRDKLEWSSKSLAGETVSLVTKDMPASVSTILKQYQNPVPI
jgi:hypothetical protein